MKCLKDLLPALDDANYLKMKTSIHSLKGGCAYVGAYRMYYICYYMQMYYVEKEFTKMLEFYPNLIEAAIEFKIECAHLIAEKKELLLPEPFDLESVDFVHSTFKLLKDPETDYVFCCRTD